MQLTKLKKAAKRGLKEVTKTKKVAEKKMKELTYQKWKENDNGGQREKILQLIQGGDLYSRDINHGTKKSFVWQHKVNQRIAKAKVIAKKKGDNLGYLFQHFYPCWRSLGFMVLSVDRRTIFSAHGDHVHFRRAIKLASGEE